MKKHLISAALLFPLFTLQGCSVLSVADAAVSVAASAVSTAASVAGTVISTTAEVGAAGVRAVLPSKPAQTPEASTKP